jgi:hypothetical protein
MTCGTDSLTVNSVIVKRLRYLEYPLGGLPDFECYITTAKFAIPLYVSQAMDILGCR